MERKGRMIAIALAVFHAIILAAYTFPDRFVPTRLRYWSQAYARVLFHQDWRLFAPDPPKCSCMLEVKPAMDAHWMPLEGMHHHFIWRRMAINACRFVEASPHVGNDGGIVVPEVLMRSIERMSGNTPAEAWPQVMMRRRCMNAGMLDAEEVNTVVNDEQR